ncbi:MFS transporter [Leptospira sp. 2 VSF19]|uniref:MFS transporter n=1 Tax=Leptospira soteropolitanensis TaxID=2950025 RepID=A0AAW5VC92_9LEPT|nr:MFS transporter [Leptospira soteropolitanensis]MCW7491839.1 MFS transporter [Leptospira soteropolitanensis]MCW7499423.1 MFS transporter [Leptospira soteropolitanensis]MCW7520986.1 MFS transporter [Leptospira soteropolitanensis]MCW7525527.1 MFS transporter [Leptospira soteropolitanensis]MCW7529393.1 MFS transporter [Leptospira soteropolitanensis]
MKKIIDKLQILGIFSITQTVFQIGTVMIMAVSALAGQTIAPSPESASLPISFVILGTLLGLVPASRLMKWKGSKFGLITGTIIGICGAILASYSMYDRNFVLFSIAHLLYGFHQAFVQYLRFVAMESVPSHDRASALSWILIAGIPAAFLGPLAGLQGKQLFPNSLYLGCYLILIFSLSLQFFFILFLPTPNKEISNTTQATNHPSPRSLVRPFSYHIQNLGLWVSILATAFSFGLMAMLMSAVPVAMKSHGHEMFASTKVLQWHVLGMYIPSFFSGQLVRKMTAPYLILLGIFVMGLESFAALQGTDFLPFAVALILLGIGWNFMYVGGTNLLVEQYHPAEKNTIQAVNDTIVYSFAILSTYSAGYLEHKIGWLSLNLVSVPFLVFVAIFTVYYIQTKKRKVEQNLL